jgi:thioesterase domain-containing protein
MKKILLAVMAVAAIGFTSCGGNKTEQGEAVDSVALIDSLSEEAIQETLDALNGVINAKDADKLKEVLEDSKAKVAELVKQNPELAKAYVAKLQKFLKENKDKVSEFAGKTAGTQDAIDAIISDESEDGFGGLIGALEDKAEAAKDNAEAAAKKQADDAKAAAKKQVEDTKAAAKEQANKAIDNAAKNAANEAKKSLGL